MISDEVCERRHLPLLVLMHNSIINEPVLATKLVDLTVTLQPYIVDADEEITEWYSRLMLWYVTSDYFQLILLRFESKTKFLMQVCELLKHNTHA